MRQLAIEYRCGHRTRNCYNELTIDEKREYVKWKYTVGPEGTREKCFDCFKKRIEVEKE
jgi:hypothetical protein